MDLWDTSRCGNSLTDSQTLDWPHTNKTIASKCQSIDSMNADQGTREGTKTSVQKGAGREVRGIRGNRRDRSRSARLRKNTRWRGSSSTSSRRRGAGAERGALRSAIRTPGALSMDTRWRGRKLSDYSALSQPRAGTTVTAGGVVILIRRPALVETRRAIHRHLYVQSVSRETLVGVLLYVHVGTYYREHTAKRSPRKTGPPASSLFFVCSPTNKFSLVLAWEGVFFGFGGCWRLTGESLPGPVFWSQYLSWGAKGVRAPGMGAFACSRGWTPISSRAKSQA